MSIKLNKYYSVVSRADSISKWLEVETFPTKKQAETYLLEYSRDDGYIDVDLRLEIIYRWEESTTNEPDYNSDDKEEAGVH